jgi:transposase-like protein
MNATTTDRAARDAELYASYLLAGKSVTTVAKTTGIARATVHDAIKRHEARQAKTVQETELAEPATAQDTKSAGMLARLTAPESDAPAETAETQDTPAESDVPAETEKSIALTAAVGRVAELAAAITAQHAEQLAAILTAAGFGTPTRRTPATSEQRLQVKAAANRRFYAHQRDDHSMCLPGRECKTGVSETVAQAS